MLSQAVGIINSVSRMGPGVLIDATKLWARPDTWTAEYKRVAGKSDFMATRAGTMDREIMAAKKGGNLDIVPKGVRDSMFTMISVMDMAVAIPTWNSAYNSALKKGATEKEAIQQGDSAVAITQGSGHDMDLAAVQRGSEMQKMFTMFYSYGSALFGQFDTYTRKWLRNKGIVNSAQFVGRMLLIFPIADVLAELASGRAPDLEDDEESLAGWLVERTVKSPFNSLPFVRDVVRSIDLGTDGAVFDFKMTPATAMVDAEVKAVGAVVDVMYKGLSPDEDVETEDWTKAGAAVAKGAGFWLSMPVSQSEIFLKASFNYMSDKDDVEARDFIFHKRRK